MTNGWAEVLIRFFVAKARGQAERASDVNLLIYKTKSNSTLNAIRGGAMRRLCGFLLCAQCADRVHASTGGKSMPKQPNVLPDSHVGLTCFGTGQGKMEHTNATQAHILLVDDDPGITEHLSRILEKGGFRVTVASDGEMALELVQTLRPDLVLLDIGAAQVRWPLGIAPHAWRTGIKRPSFFLRSIVRLPT